MRRDGPMNRDNGHGTGVFGTRAVRGVKLRPDLLVGDIAARARHQQIGDGLQSFRQNGPWLPKHLCHKGLILHSNTPISFATRASVSSSLGWFSGAIGSVPA